MISDSHYLFISLFYFIPCVSIAGLISWVTFNSMHLTFTYKGHLMFFSFFSFFSLIANVLIIICMFWVLGFGFNPLLLFLQVWGTLIMQKRYRGPDYLLAFLVTVGCSFFILYPVTTIASVSPFYLLLLLNIHLIVCTLNTDDGFQHDH